MDSVTLYFQIIHACQVKYNTQLKLLLCKICPPFHYILVLYLLATIFSFIFLNNGFYEVCVSMCIKNCILVPSKSNISNHSEKKFLSVVSIYQSSFI